MARKPIYIKHCEICGVAMLRSDHGPYNFSRKKCCGKECRSKLITKNQTTHNMTHSRIYGIWGKMKERCSNKKAPNYHYYGGRGISVCDRWQKFENFIADMGIPPNKFQLDRIDNELGYSKENCRWATAKENARNKRTSRVLILNGEPKHLLEISERFHVGTETIWKRLKRGLSVEDAVSIHKNRTAL